MFKDKKWVIPSHYNYPADAKDRLSKTAAARHGPDQGHDPLGPRRGPGGDGRDRPARCQGHDPQGRGKRITLRDASEKVLADFIIGNEIKGPSERTAGQRYVRVPGQKRTYGVNVKADLRPGSPTGSRPTCSSSRPARSASRVRQPQGRTPSRG